MSDRRRYYFAKGRVAFFALLKAFGVGAGDRVLMPGYTCIVVPLAVRYLDAIPEYADVDQQVFNSTLANYRTAYARLEAAGKATSLRAVVLQHSYGAVNAESRAITEWAHSMGLIVVEDCAHVWVDDPNCGGFGDAAFYSAQWSKPLTTGLGGIAVLNDESRRAALDAIFNAAPAVSTREAYVLAFLLFVHSILVRPRLYSLMQSGYRALSNLGILAGSSSVAEMQGEIPRRYLRRMHPMQVRIFEKRAGRMAGVQRRRRELGSRFDELLRSRGMRPFQRPGESTLIRYPMLVSDRDELILRAKARGIPLGDWFNHPLHPRTANLEGLNWHDANCPVAVATARAIVNLPMDVRMTEHEALAAVELAASGSLTRAAIEVS